MSAGVDNWMPLWIGDYLADTMHLTTEQHGTYLLLLMHLWKHGELPDSDETLATIARLSPAAWKRSRVVIARFFVIADGLWTQKRLAAEKDKATDTKERISEARSAAGKRGAKKRWQKPPPSSEEDDDGAGNDIANAWQNDGKPDSKDVANAWQNDGKPDSKDVANAWQRDSSPPSPSTTSLTVGSAAREPSPAVVLSIEARKLGVQVTGSDPRVIALADQGVAPATLQAAIEEGRRALGAAPAFGYVVAILNSWSERASKVAAGGAAQPVRGGGVVALPSAATPDEALLRRISERHGGESVTKLPDGRMRCGGRYYRPDGREEMAI